MPRPPTRLTAHSLHPCSPLFARLPQPKMQYRTGLKRGPPRRWGTAAPPLAVLESAEFSTSVPLLFISPSVADPHDRRHADRRPLAEAQGRDSRTHRPALGARATCRRASVDTLELAQRRGQAKALGQPSPEVGGDSRRTG